MSSTGMSRGRAEDGASVREIFRFLMRRRDLILGVAAFTASLIFVIVLAQPLKYSAVSSVMIVAPHDIVTAEGTSGAPKPDSAYVESQMEILQSPSIIGQVVDRLKLKDDPEWNPLLKPLHRWEAELQQRKIPTPWRPSEAADRGALIEKVAAAISVRRKGVSNVIEITIIAPRPSQAAAMANAIVDAFIALKERQRIETDQKANTWLSERLRSLKEEVQNKERAEEAYKARSGLLAAAGASLTEQQIIALQTAISNAQNDLAERQARLSQLQGLIESGASAESIDDSINSATIHRLRDQEAAIIKRQAETETRYGEAHPAVAQIREERSGIESQIQSEIARISANVRNEAGVAKARLAALQQTRSLMQNQIVNNNAESVKLRELERESAATRSLYEQFLTRYRQVTETETLKQNDAYPLSDGSVSSRLSGPPLGFLALMCVMLGLMAGFLVAKLVDAMDDSIQSAEAMERKLGIAALASIPLVRTADMSLLAPAERHPPAYIVERPMSPFAEGLRSLRATLVYALRGHQAKIICITSALPNEGKTTTSLCLARIAALSGQKTIIIDCDLRRRSLNQLLEITPKQGLLDCILDGCDWRDIIVSDDITTLDALPVVDAAFTPRDVFGSEAMRGLLEDLRSHYDLIVLDCPPILAVAETGMISRLADQTVMVARWSKTPVTAVRRAVKRVEKAGGEIRGLVLNGVNANARGKLSYLDIAYQSKYAKKYYAA